MWPEWERDLKEVAGFLVSVILLAALVVLIVRGCGS